MAKQRGGCLQVQVGFGLWGIEREGEEKLRGGWMGPAFHSRPRSGIGDIGSLEPLTSSGMRLHGGCRLVGGEDRGRERRRGDVCGLVGKVDGHYTLVQC
jgi:hypothetical protein